MQKNLVYWLVLLILLSGCQSQQSEQPSFPIVATPPAFTQAPPLTENSAPTAAPTSTPIQPVEPTLTPTEILPGEPVLGVHINDFSNLAQIELFTRPEQLWTRYDKFNWSLIEPQRTDPPTYDWSPVDEAGLANAGSSGMRIIGIVLFAPDWAQKYPPSACGPISEDALERFGQFMNAVVSRYSQPPYNVHYWELGNEPDVDRRLVPPDSGFGCWGDMDDPFYGGGYYAEMLKVVYPQIKAADPESKVLIGGLLLDCDPNNPPIDTSGAPRDCRPAKFLDGVLQNGGGDFFDGISYHSYDFYLNELGKYASGGWNSSWDTTGPVLVPKTRYLRSLLESFGYSDKLLLNTELALICGRDGKEPECQTEEYQRTKAYYLAQAGATGLAEGLDVNVWYSLRGWRGSGLVQGRNLKPHLAYHALQFSVDQLERASYLGEITTFPGVKVYEFSRDGTRFWVLWSQNGQSQTISLPESPASVFDVFGESLPADQELEVTFAPKYVEWIP